MPDPIFDEWKRLTRWWNCTTTAAARERIYWANAGFKDPSAAEVVFSHRPKSNFKISAKDYAATLDDEPLMASLVLLMSWTLLEQRGREVLGLRESDQLSQIEDWGAKALNGRGASWSRVFGGKKGLVEVATVRNAVAHGNHRVTQRMLNRVEAAGGTVPWKHLSAIRLDVPTVSVYRDRIRSFIRLTSSNHLP
jgi:hypothetical protein